MKIIKIAENLQDVWLPYSFECLGCGQKWKDRYDVYPYCHQCPVTVSCRECGESFISKKNLKVCPKCGRHHVVTNRRSRGVLRLDTSPLTPGRIVYTDIWAAGNTTAKIRSLRKSYVSADSNGVKINIQFSHIYLNESDLNGPFKIIEKVGSPPDFQSVQPHVNESAPCPVEKIVNEKPQNPFPVRVHRPYATPKTDRSGVVETPGDFQ